MNKMRKASNAKKIRICSLQILEMINQLNTVQCLNRNQSSLNSFDWFKQPKYELQGQNTQTQKLKFTVGAYCREYMFELT